jgi:uncharacterized protein
MTAASFLIKPASGRCNLACRYCFYRDEVENRSIADFGLMSAETTARLVERAFELRAQHYSFGFQGGEPTLAGLAFFKHFAALVHDHNTAGATISYALQTNATTLDADWALFLKEEGFLVGVSLDGPRLIHDMMRINRDGSGSYDRVLTGIDILRTGGVPMNALCVVDAAVADNPAKVYQHLRRRGFDWIQFIPCLDPLGEEPGGHTWSLTPPAYAHFLKTTFDLWFDERRRGISVSVRWFDNLVGMAMGYPPENCGMAGRCSAYFTVEADGSVYPCDFYVMDEWRLGNLHEVSLQTMATGAIACQFVAVSEHQAAECQDCFARLLCRGGCRRDREPFSDGKPVLNRYCAAYKDFFGYAGQRIITMAGTRPAEGG